MDLIVKGTITSVKLFSSIKGQHARIWVKARVGGSPDRPSINEAPITVWGISEDQTKQLKPGARVCLLGKVKYKDSFDSQEEGLSAYAPGNRLFIDSTLGYEAVLAGDPHTAREKAPDNEWPVL